MIKTSIILTLITAFTLTATAQTKSLKGTWQFNGGIYNGKPDGAPKDYKLQRIYTDHNFTAFASQKGYKTERYEAGNYSLKGDTCFESQTFSSRPSQLVSTTVAYIIKLQKDELIFSGKLPSGMVVEEHWIRIPPTTKK
jgi:hypothetical protein